MAVLSWILMTPLVGAIALLFLRDEKRIKQTAFVFTLLPLLLSLAAYHQFDPNTPDAGSIAEARQTSARATGGGFASLENSVRTTGGGQAW